MYPTLEDGQLVLFSSLKLPMQNDVVLSSNGKLSYVKRLHKTKTGFSLRGDNVAQSTDLEGVDLNMVVATLIFPNLS